MKIKDLKGKTNNPGQQTKTAVEGQCRKQGHSGKTFQLARKVN